MSRATSTADNAIAVTGATGFVGQAVLDAARAQGVPVKALTRREQPPQDGVIWVRGDLQDTGALADLAANTKAMIHVAGLTNTPDPAEFEAANVTGTGDVLAACAEAQCKRLVFVSSLSAREPLLSAYGASKAQAETLVEQSALDWTIVRPPAVYGPRDTDMFELFRAAKLGFIPMPPRGATSIIHVMDLARLLLGLVDAGGIAHKQLYEPDDGREGGWAHKELAQAIGAAMGRSVWAPNLPRGMVKLGVAIDRLARGDRAKLTADRASYMCHPNWVARFDRKPPRGLWQPEFSGEVGLAQTAQWYREAGKL